MDNSLYNMIYKRKSFHLFRGVEREISEEELKKINEFLKNINSLIPDIKTEIKIVPEKETTCKRGAEYCILFYSEKKDNYLQNIGYIGEELDLYLTSLNIGALWYGIGKPKETLDNGLEYIIMIAIAKMSEDSFRKDMFKSKRKELEEVWQGEKYRYIGNITRFAPSACNLQPWIVKEEENKLNVFRYRKEGKRGIMPVHKVIFYNRIDIGIYMYILEICLKNESIDFERKLYPDNDEGENAETLNAIYILK